LDDLYEQCSLHITEKMPSSVKFGVRPRIATARSNSSSVSPCSIARAGVTLLPRLKNSGSHLSPPANGGERILATEGRSSKQDLIYCSAPTNPPKNACPSVPPSSGSVAFSGCGISPRIVRVSLKMPAIARAEPLKLVSFELSPLGPQ